MTADVVCTKIYIHYFTLDCHPYVCVFSSCYFHICIILKNKINEALFSPSFSYILNYSQYYSTWFMDSIYSHFPLNLPFVFTITLLVLLFSFLITTQDVFYNPHKTFNISLVNSDFYLQLVWINYFGLILCDKSFLIY